MLVFGVTGFHLLTTQSVQVIKLIFYYIFFVCFDVDVRIT